ncbi:hypothetical protein CKY20_03765 [Capnocytophaga canis]|uniref:6-bladed beta-propeller n=1 Tax=Capnocytophaga canis TaxID=1848903 RepID=A0A3A1YMH0_9FLAO|nr:hypothetical protein [Capnocytophaga canis]RIY37217.1 hypothetical protein CKY20_03765 [Capnocytophaga canis]
MKSYIGIVCFCICFTFVSCEQKDKILNFSDNPVQLFFKDSIPINQLLNVEQMQVTNNSNLVIRNSATDTIFSVYDLQDLKHIGNIGYKGSGPNDFLMPLIIHAESDSLFVFDFAKDGFSCIINKKRSQLWKGLFIKETPLSMLLTENKIVLDTKDGERLRLVTYDTSVGELNELFSFEEINNLNIPINLKTGYWTKLSKKDIFVYAYQYIPKIDIISSSGKLLKTILYENQAFPSSNDNVDYGKTMVYNFKVLASSEHFFIYRINQEGGKIMDKDIKTFIDKYSLEGDLIETYQLNTFFKDFVIWNDLLVGVKYPEQDCFMIYEFPKK